MSKFLFTSCPMFGLLLSSASAEESEADKSAEAWRKEGVQKLEFNRFVSAGKKSRLILRTHLTRTARL